MYIPPFFTDDAPHRNGSQPTTQIAPPSTQTPLASSHTRACAPAAPAAAAADPPTAVAVRLTDDADAVIARESALAAP